MSDLRAKGTRLRTDTLVDKISGHIVTVEVSPTPGIVCETNSVLVVVDEMTDSLQIQVQSLQKGSESVET